MSRELESVAEVREEPDNSLPKVVVDAAPRVGVGVGNGLSGLYSLKWALEKVIPANGTVYLLHVQPPLRWIPYAMGAKFPVQQANHETVKRFKETLAVEKENLVLNYRRLCEKRKVGHTVCYSENDSVYKGLVDQILKLGITKFIMGTSSQSLLSRALKKENIPTAVAKNAPPFCAVMVICKGKLCFVKEAMEAPKLQWNSLSSVSSSNEIGITVVSKASTSNGNVLNSEVNKASTSSDNILEDDQIDSKRSRDVEGSTSSEAEDSVYSSPRTRLIQSASMNCSQGSYELLLSDSRSTAGLVSPLMTRNYSNPSESWLSQSTLATTTLHQPFSPPGHTNNQSQSQESSSNEASIAKRRFSADSTIQECDYGDETMPPWALTGPLSLTALSENASAVAVYPDYDQASMDLGNINHIKDKPTVHELLMAEHEKQWNAALEEAYFARQKAAEEARRCGNALAALQLVTRERDMLRQTIAEEVRKHEQTKAQLETQSRLIDAYVIEVATERRKCDEALMGLADVRSMLEIESQLRRAAEAKVSEESVAKVAAIAALQKERQNYTEYTFEELGHATNNFHHENKLGEGGYGPVYKGRLHHTAVAIKVLAHDGSHGRNAFQSEIEVLSRIRHPHMVMLLGACPEKGCIVYEYMANGSLEDRLHCKQGTPPLPWYVRFRICLEVATALLFLHSRPEPIVHRDLKPGNILLDHHFVSKIGDVGLAKLVPNNLTFTVTMYKESVLVGTFAYIDPDYQRTGVVSCESDVYALGVIMLQLLTGRAAVGVTDLVEEAVDSGHFDGVLDKSGGEWPLAEALALACLSLRCAEPRRKHRPNLEKEILPQLESIQKVADIAAAGMASAGATLFIPSFFYCPILQEIMEDPHIAADGFTYEHNAIKAWLQAHSTSPMTNLMLGHKNLTPNHTLRSAIQEWYNNKELILE